MRLASHRQLLQHGCVIGQRARVLDQSGRTSAPISPHAVQTMRRSSGRRTVSSAVDVGLECIVLNGRGLGSVTTFD
jgi:hypothetical protein